MFVTGRGVGVPRNARDGAWRNAAGSNLVTLVWVAPIGLGGSCGDQFPAINEGSKIQISGIDAKPAFREQEVAKNDAWTLEPVGDIEHLGNDLETVSNIERCGD